MTAKYYICSSCQEENSYRSFATDQVELEREVGVTIPVNCAHCHARKTVHPNDIQAKPNVWVPIIASVPAVALLIWLVYQGWILISVALFSVPVLVWAAQRKSSAAFNSYRIKRPGQSI